MIIIHQDNGLARRWPHYGPKVYYDSVDSRNRLSFNNEVYALGLSEANYPVPTTIGYEVTKYGVYQLDTRWRFDGMPLFRGYTWSEWLLSDM